MESAEVNSGQFLKGHESWNKGRTGVFSKETREKMRLAKLGNVPWNKGMSVQTNSGRTHFEKGHVPANKDTIGEMKPNCRSYTGKAYQMPDLESWQLAYAAGFIDGEGSICVVRYGPGKKYWRGNISIPQKDPAPLLAIREWFALDKHLFRVESTRNINYKDYHLVMWRLCINARNEVRSIVTALLPYLIIKKAAAEILLQRYAEDAAQREIM